MIKKNISAKQKAYHAYLIESEKSKATISKYIHDVSELVKFIGKRELSKAIIAEYKSYLTENFKPSGVNSKLAAVNSFLEFIGRSDCKVKPLKLQKNIFSNARKELKKSDYEKLVKYALKSGNERLALILQTICSTGIRVSELQYITVSAVQKNTAEINCKGKFRVIFIPKLLGKLLRQYIKKEKITAGAVFVTRNKKPISRSQIWRMMKEICEKSGVSPEKVFPHNLRHLFARTYYSREKDIFRLADILGHSSVNTTRIYTMESGEMHRRQLDSLNLVLQQNIVYVASTRKKRN